MENLWPGSEDSSALSENMLHIWAVRLDADSAPGEEVSASLSADERQRAEQFVLEPPRRRFVLTRGALRALLGKRLGLSPREVPLVLDMRGKPRLAGGLGVPDWRFNVAHSGELALIAMTVGCEVGVDLEQVRTVRQAAHIARRYFHPWESKAVRTAPPSRRDATFLRIWTAKEAVLKAVGSGITGSLAGCPVPTEAHDGTWIELPGLRLWLLSLEPAHGYLGAAAVVGTRLDVRWFLFEWAESGDRGKGMESPRLNH